ncbi:MAG: exo-alpha-sialidase [Magnetococcales bacterium]|nr:exo-alpha-sialidase [Magnetococcales bacterium]
MGTINFHLSAWTTPTNVGDPGGCLCGGCDITANSDGTLFVSRVIQGGGITVEYSTDKGLTWNSTVVVSGGVEYYPHASTILADAADTIHLFFVDANHVPQHAKSFDDGLTWSIQTLSAQLSHCSRHLDAIINSSKTRIYLLVRDDDDGTVFFLRSDDSGLSWNSPIAIATPLAHLGWAVRLQMAIAGNGTLHVLAEAIINDQRDTYLSRSTDDGATWIPWYNTWHSGTAVAASLAAFSNGQLVVVFIAGTALTAAASMNDGNSWVSYPILTTPNIFDLWSPPGLIKDPNGILNVFVYLGGVHAIRHLYSSDNAATWTLGEIIFTAQAWKTPSDIQTIWANGVLNCAASVGRSQSDGMVQFTAGDPLVIHQTPRLHRIEPDFIASAVGNHFYLLDAGNTGNGSSIASVLERVGINPEGSDSVITVLEVWPDCSMDTEVTIQMGYQMTSDAAVTWHAPVTLNPMATDYAPVRITGRYIAIRFIIENDCAWAMHGYTLVYEKSGNF